MPTARQLFFVRLVLWGLFFAHFCSFVFSLFLRFLADAELDTLHLCPAHQPAPGFSILSDVSIMGPHRSVAHAKSTRAPAAFCPWRRIPDRILARLPIPSSLTETTPSGMRRRNDQS